MKMVRGLSVAMLALALVGTACGTRQADVPAGPEVLPEQVVVPPASEQGDEKKAEDEERKAGEVDPDTPVSSSDTPSGSNGGAGAGAGAGAVSGGVASGAGSAGSGQGSASGGGSGTGGAGTSGNGGSTGAGTGGGTQSGSSGSAGQTSPGSQGTAGGKASAGQYRLDVTQNFGGTNLFAQSVPFAPKQDLLSSMREHLEVETAYGGGFVNSINGIASGYTDKSIFTRKKRDWFYYVNGSVSAVGADAYSLRAGDAVWWDYHDWSGGGSNAPAVIGSYPHPFTTGYDGAQPGTVIYYGGTRSDDANRLAGGLKNAGAANVRVAPYADGKILNAATNVIVIGTWAELSGQSAVQELFGAPTRTGLYASFDGNGATALNFEGKATERKGQAAILATGTGNGDTTPLWLVVGAKEASLDQAIDLLVGQSGSLKGKIGAMIDGNGKVVGVPIAE